MDLVLVLLHRYDAPVFNVEAPLVLAVLHEYTTFLTPNSSSAVQQELQGFEGLNSPLRFTRTTTTVAPAQSRPRVATISAWIEQEDRGRSMIQVSCTRERLIPTARQDPDRATTAPWRERPEPWVAMVEASLTHRMSVDPAWLSGTPFHRSPSPTFQLLLRVIST